MAGGGANYIFIGHGVTKIRNLLDDDFTNTLAKTILKLLSGMACEYPYLDVGQATA
jgi:hypothetical protein